MYVDTYIHMMYVDTCGQGVKKGTHPEARYNNCTAQQRKKK